MVDYRLTPWDTRAFGFKTAEIFISQEACDLERLKKALLDTERTLIELEVDFVYLRINSQNFSLRKSLHDNGYYFAECSQEIRKTDVQKFIKPKLPVIAYSIAKEYDYSEIKDICRDSFKHGRFHEDTRVDNASTQARYYNWVDDLKSQKAEIYTAKIGEKIVGINVQKSHPKEKKNNLILTGCKKGQELFALSLWSEVILDNKEKEVRIIDTVISASNIGVANLYSFLGFKVTATLFGYHKFL